MEGGQVVKTMRSVLVGCQDDAVSVGKYRYVRNEIYYSKSISHKFLSALTRAPRQEAGQEAGRFARDLHAESL